MKRKVYIFNGISRAAVYGIGTYIDQLIDCLRKVGIDFGVVHLYSEGTEVTIVEKNGYRQISIPNIYSLSPYGSDGYARNVVYLLKDLLPSDKNMEYIFHLNFMSNSVLVSTLKKMFRCKIITTVHYTNWGLSLMGNQRRLQFILSGNSTKLDSFEKQIREDVRVNKRMLEKSDRFICVAQHTLDDFKNICNVDVTNGVLINNALKDVYKQVSPTQKIIIKSKYFISGEIKIVLFAGRLDEIKGVPFLIKAFKEVVQTNPNLAKPEPNMKNTIFVL